MLDDVGWLSEVCLAPVKVCWGVFLFLSIPPFPESCWGVAFLSLFPRCCCQLGLVFLFLFCRLLLGCFFSFGPLFAVGVVGWGFTPSDPIQLVLSVGVLLGVFLYLPSGPMMTRHSALQTQQSVYPEGFSWSRGVFLLSLLRLDLAMDVAGVVPFFPLLFFSFSFLWSMMRMSATD